MALVDKYYLDFYSQDTKQYRLQIQQEGWGGSNTDISVDDDGAPVPVNIAWKGDDDIFSVIHGSNLTAGLYSVTDLKWKEFFDVSYGSYAAELQEVGAAAFNTKSLLLDGVDETVNMDSIVGDVSTHTQGTISFWMKPVAAVPATGERLINFGDTDGPSFVTCVIQATGLFQWALGNNGSTKWIVRTSSSPFSDNTWAHVCLVHDGTAPKIYVNAVEVAHTHPVTIDETQYFNDISAYIDNARFGSLNYNSGGETGHFNGNVDEITIFDTAFSSGQVTTLYNSGVPKDESATANLVAGWRMGEGASDNYNSDTANEWTFKSVIGTNDIYTVNCEEADVEADVIASGAVANTVLWTGYIESGMYSEPWQGVPYPISLNFNCGLGRLKNITFTADGTRAGTKHTGAKSLLEVIRLCLNQLPTPLSIREVYNIYEETQTTATSDSPLTQVYILPEYYNELDSDQEPPIESARSCWDVLVGVLGSLGARIFQWDNYWYIVRHEEIDATTLTYREFLPRVGSESTLTVDSSGTISHDLTISNDTANRDNRIFPFQGAGQLDVLSALEKIKINYSPTPDDTLDSDFVKNPCLGVWSSPQQRTPPLAGDGMPWLWTAGSGITDPDTYNARLGLGPWAYPPCEDAFGFKKSDLDASTTFDSNAYIEMQNTAVPTASADLFTFSIGYMRDIDIANPVAHASDAWTLAQSAGRVQMRLMIQIGTKYWVGNNLSSSMTDPSGTLIAPAPPVWDTSVGYYDIYMNALPTPDEINNQFLNHTVQLSAIGLDGVQTLTVRIYLPINNVVSTDALVVPVSDSIEWADNGFFVTGVHCWYLPSGAPEPEEVILSSVLDADADVYEIDVTHGDGPSAGSLASFRLSDNSITQTWSRRGQGDAITITKQLANMITRMRGEHRINVSGGITGTIDYYNRLKTTVSTSGGDVTYAFLIQSLEWDVQNYEYNISMVELDTTNTIPTFEDVTVGPIVTLPTGSPVSSDPPPPDRTSDDLTGGTGLVSSSSTSSDFPTS